MSDDLRGFRVPERFRPLLEDIVRRIAVGDYEGVSRDFSPYAGDPRHDLGLWARQYPARLVPLPAAAWEEIECMHFEERSEWEVWVDLWSDCGRTDLTLLVDVIDHGGEIDVRVRDLRVM
ncbi:hypothetical protein [Catellatospora sp. TT07R-123]|uniref:DUF7668 domain-containing protein n=1 Tax=Catellatospora sp. TT07R-123 TaxID=2733863 RepID=UPI001BB385DA|nr:hypothetical protein [Catellatospora sp. TT07R-123]